jgi:hypothetical protein
VTSCPSFPGKIITKIRGGYIDRQQGDLISLKIRGDIQTHGQTQMFPNTDRKVMS